MKYYASLSVYRICGRQNDHEPQTDCQFRRVACIAFTLFLYLWKESGRFSLLRKGRKQCFYPFPGPSSRQIPVPQSPSGRCQNRNSRQQGGCQAEDFLQKQGGRASAGPVRANPGMAGLQLIQSLLLPSFPYNYPLRSFNIVKISIPPVINDFD